MAAPRGALRALRDDARGDARDNAASERGRSGDDGPTSSRDAMCALLERPSWPIGSAGMSPPLPTFVEEVLRTDGPIMGVPRVATAGRLPPRSTGPRRRLSHRRDRGDTATRLTLRRPGRLDRRRPCTPAPRLRPGAPLLPGRRLARRKPSRCCRAAVSPAPASSPHGRSRRSTGSRLRCCAVPRALGPTPGSGPSSGSVSAPERQLTRATASARPEVPGSSFTRPDAPAKPPADHDPDGLGSRRRNTARGRHGTPFSLEVDRQRDGCAPLRPARDSRERRARQPPERTSATGARAPRTPHGAHSPASRAVPATTASDRHPVCPPDDPCRVIADPGEFSPPPPAATEIAEGVPSAPGRDLRWRPASANTLSSSRRATAT